MFWIFKEKCHLNLWIRIGVAGPHRKGSLKVVHKNGPCSQLNQDKTKIPTDVEILEQDQLRAEFIQYSRHSKRLGGKVLRRKSESKGSANIPANLGRSFRTNNYIVTVGLGTPKRSLTLAFDTGSDLTWTQCQPCAGSCYDQDDVIFNPSHSSTYTNITCSSPLCSQLLSATGTDYYLLMSWLLCMHLDYQYHGDHNFRFLSHLLMISLWVKKCIFFFFHFVIYARFISPATINKVYKEKHPNSQTGTRNIHEWLLSFFFFL